MKENKTDALSIPLWDGGVRRSALTQRIGTARSTAFERRLIHRMWEALGQPRVGIELWDGYTVAVGSPNLRINDRGALWRLLVNPDLHFGDDYSVGRLDVDGPLETFLNEIYRTLPEDFPIGGVLGAGFISWLYRARENSLAGSRHNIAHHYDIGNDFYKLWLCDELVYTCAYYATPQLTLAEAQVAKMEHICRKLRLRPGETVVEAGCGWGALSRHMAKRYGVKVKAFNISEEQVREARSRAKAEGLDGQVEFVLDDYRNIGGSFDAFVSVGMLEHVGVNHYRNLGAVIDRVLARNGRGLVHSIGKNYAGPMNPWIEKRIFPGAYPPTLREMMEIFEPHHFSVLDVENLRLHYARTLEHWLEAFETRTDQVRAMFDEHFVRAWRLYLAGSIASFESGSLQLFQVLFTRQDNNEVPWTRTHLYPGEE